MENAINIIENIIKENFAKPNFFKRNLIREYLQILVLDYIYSHAKYSNLIFYGGSCLFQCFALPRLSEDLDFVDVKGNVNIGNLAKYLEKFFQKKTDLKILIKTQKFRIYLKFPILKKIGLAKGSEHDFLFLKVEVFKHFDFCKKYNIEIKPLFKFNKSILIKTFDLPTLMSTKIRAVLDRKWEKTNKNGATLIKVKGRDYFDLMWYLDQGIKPNLDCLNGLKEKQKLKIELLDVIKKIDARSIILDLENFISDRNFVVNLSKNIKDILKSSIKNL